MTRRTRLITIGVGAGVYGLSGPGQTAGFSVFVDPVSEALGLSRSQLTMIYLAATFLAAPTGIWLGRRLDRHRTATMIRGVATMLAIALVVVSLAPNPLVLAIGVFGLRAFGQSGMSLTSTVLVARSIDERRGAALGWLAALAGFAITLTPLLASRVIPIAGWRQTWLALAAVVLIGSYLLATITTRVGIDRRNAPSATPADTTPADTTSDRDRVPPEPQASEITTGQIATAAQQRWALIVITAAVATTGGVATALGFHQIAVLGERGLSATQAATNFLPQSLAAAACAIAVGRAVDRVPGRLVLVWVMSLLAMALASLWLVHSPITAVIFGLLLGTGVASNHASEGALLARWTGTVGLATRRGRMMAFSVTSTAVAPLVFTVLADVTGSFTRAATILMIVPISVATMALMAPLAEPRPWSARSSSRVLEPIAHHHES